MKQLILICTLILTSVSISFAQPQREGRASNRDFHALQMSLILKRLEIKDAATETKFKDLYSEYSAILREMRPKHSRDQAGLTEQQIEEQILDSFTVAEKTTALKREYYQKFREVLTPRQILKMYTTERQISQRISSEMQKRDSNKRMRGRE